MGDGVFKRWILPGFVLLASSSVCGLLAFVLPPVPVETDLEADSDAIGWTEANESQHIARDIFERVNDERSARGLAPLVWDEELADVAGRWSQEMIATGYRHSPASFRALSRFAGTGENIHMGTRHAGEAHAGWMESDGHRDNLLLPEFSAIGIGVVCRNDGRMWATQVLGLPHGVEPTGGPTSPEPIVRRDDGPSCPGGGRRPFGEN